MRNNAGVTGSHRLMIRITSNNLKYITETNNLINYIIKTEAVPQIERNYSNCVTSNDHLNKLVS
jgi:hypothetical protein